MPEPETIEQAADDASALLHCQQEFQRILENVPDIILRLDLQQRIIYANPAIRQLTDEPSESLVGRSLADLANIDSDFLHAFSANLRQLFEQNSPFTAELSAVGTSRPNEPLHFHARYVPERAESGTLLSALCILHDITIYKQMMREIARLDRLNLIGEMAAGIGHEVRNPMTTVRGFLQVLQRKPEYQPQHEFFQLMIEELDRANSIISEFLSLAKNRPVHLEEQNLTQIVQSLLPLMQADATLTDNYLEAELAPVPPLPLDEKEIRQLLLNLVRNGIEAMPHGGRLLLRTYLEPGHVCLEVSDQGPGIPAEILAKLGTPFLTTKQNGTGLGLAVCYSIVARHNATLYPKSGPNGTAFIIKFPF